MQNLFEVLPYLIGALVFGIFIGIITRPSRKKCESISDLEEAAVLEFREKFWHKDIGHGEFASLIQEIREEAWVEKQKIEWRIVRLSKRIKK